MNKQRRKDGQDSLPWNMAVKFLMARKFDCQRALELYLNHEVRVKFELNFTNDVLVVIGLVFLVCNLPNQK